MPDEKQQYTYSVKPADECAPEKPSDNETIPDPLENLPDVSDQTAGLPIVLFVMVCITAFAVMAVKKILAGCSVVVTIVCVFFALAMVFGDCAMVPGILRKLRQDGSKRIWQSIAPVLIAAALVLGTVVGSMCAF